MELKISPFSLSIIEPNNGDELFSETIFNDGNQNLIVRYADVNGNVKAIVEYKVANVRYPCIRRERSLHECNRLRMDT